jgi:hypothetical protein
MLPAWLMPVEVAPDSHMTTGTPIFEKFRPGFAA